MLKETQKGKNDRLREALENRAVPAVSDIARVDGIYRRSDEGGAA